MAAAASLRALAPRSDNRRAGRSERGRGRCWTGTPPREASRHCGRTALAEATGALAQPWHPGPSSEGHLRKASLRKGHRRRHRPRVVCQRGPREDCHDDPPNKRELAAPWGPPHRSSPSGVWPLRAGDPDSRPPCQCPPCHWGCHHGTLGDSWHSVEVINSRAPHFNAKK